MKIEELLALVDVIIDDKINSTQLPTGPKGSRGPRGFDGVNGKDFTWSEFSSEIIDEIKKHSVSFAELTEDEKKSLRGSRGFRGQKGSRGVDGKNFVWSEHESKIFSEIKNNSLTFNKLTEDQKNELKGEQGPKGPRGFSGRDGKDGDKGDSFVWEEHKDLIFSQIEKCKLKFSDLSEEDKLSLKGARGFKGQKGSRGIDGKDGKNFSWEENKEEISKIIKNNKLKFSDLSSDEKEEIRGPQGIKGSRGIPGKDGIDGKSFSWEENKDKILSRIDANKLKFSDLSEDEIKSLRGARGLRGQKGKSGIDGLSAFDIWLKNNKGNELDFLKSLKGLNGVPGLKGLDGKNGINGTNGIDGIDGEDAPLITKVEVDKLSIGRYRFVFYFSDGSKLKTNEIKIDSGNIIQQITSSSLAETSISIEDEGNEITEKATSINFVGDLVSSVDDGSGNVTVSVSSPDTSSIVIRNVNCESTVFLGSAVRMNSSEVAVNAIADSVSNSNVLGFVESKSSSILCDIRVSGITAQNYSGLDVTKEYYLSDTVAGSIQTNVPTTSGHVKLKLGQPFSSTKMLFMKGEIIKRA